MGNETVEVPAMPRVKLSDIEAFTEGSLGISSGSIREISIRSGLVEVYHWPEGRPGPLACEVYIIDRGASDD